MIHKVRFSFEKCITAVLFAAVCAYLSARLFDVFTLEDSLVLISETVCESIGFEGMALRNEIPLGISGEKVVCDNGERIAAGFELCPGAVSPTSAIYLEKCDGFEYLSPPEGNITADIVNALIKSEPHAPSKGRLVTGKFWYCVCLADGDAPEGRCRVRIETYDEVLTGFVSKCGDNAFVIRFALGDVKYLSERRLSGEIILKEYKGFAVPDSAVYEKDGKNYVCVITPAGEQEQEAEVLYRYDGKALLKKDGELQEGARITGHTSDLFPEGSFIVFS